MTADIGEKADKASLMLTEGTLTAYIGECFIRSMPMFGRTRIQKKLERRDEGQKTILKVQSGKGGEGAIDAVLWVTGVTTSNFLHFPSVKHNSYNLRMSLDHYSESGLRAILPENVKMMKFRSQ